MAFSSSGKLSCIMLNCSKKGIVSCTLSIMKVEKVVNAPRKPTAKKLRRGILFFSVYCI